jgi:hypothetical protein
MMFSLDVLELICFLSMAEFELLIFQPVPLTVLSWLLNVTVMVLIMLWMSVHVS